MIGTAAVYRERELYPVRRYSPEGGFRAGGLIRLLVALALLGLALGVATHFISKLIYFIILFPALIGAGVGALGVRLVKTGHIRAPWLGGLAGFLGGMFAMFIMHYADYYEFRQTVMADLPQEILAMSDQELTAAAEATDSKEAKESLVPVVHAVKSFPAFLQLAAHQGVEISHNGSSPINLGYYGSFIYWGIEVLIVALIALFMMYESASAPYCGPCEVWKEPTTLGVVTGDAGLAKQGVENGDPGQLAASQPDPHSTGQHMLYRSVCPTCGGGKSSIDVKMMQFIRQAKGEPKKKVMAHASWPGEALAAIDNACRPPVAATADAQALQDLPMATDVAP